MDTAKRMFLKNVLLASCDNIFRDLALHIADASFTHISIALDCACLIRKNIVKLV